MVRRYREYGTLVYCEVQIKGKYYPISGKFKFKKPILGEGDLMWAQQKMADISDEVSNLNISASDIIITGISSLKIK
ncbi:hypothetical protein [Listeria booriae]|uniref:hypothetical protein n=1 Tax=Listeria booriae TaxID=1552123 RepID=UPI001627FCA8|nr:hypothetical protein [Listeria booriae]MBC1892437.1 hypothetical protein [Listeria booriae]MBC1974546.1 hypothetical protein [Listeria booriae]MBC1983478.1 hypothetical protein [Listeria booriae]MBC2031838.1 hypothetical protein [Listeria booriae]